MTRPSPKRPAAKGWCPGAYRPMVSGDGLVVRVRPFHAELAPDQLRALCALARRFGNGTLDLTSRANLQLRGVREGDHPALLAGLQGIGLLDADPSLEGRRNILIAPDWRAGDLTNRLCTALLDTLPALPALPEKMGVALDTGAQAWLRAGSADFRFERDDAGELLLRADGAPRGRRIDEDRAMQALAELATWFIDTGGKQAGRMARHLRATALPEAWQTHAPRPAAAPLAPGPVADGMILGIPFGRIDAAALEALTETPGVTSIRLMLDRLLWVHGAAPELVPGFVTTPDSPLLKAHACPGAPLCAQATVETRGLAERLAEGIAGTVHVSGCAKGCAWPKRADVTLIGRGGRFDLVVGGAPWDEPQATGLGPEDLHDLTGIP